MIKKLIIEYNLRNLTVYTENELNKFHTTTAKIYYVIFFKYQTCLISMIAKWLDLIALALSSYNLFMLILILSSN